MLWGVPPRQALTRKVDPAELVNLSSFDSTMGMPMPLDVQVCADGAHPGPAHTSLDPPAEADPCSLLSSQLKMMKEANSLMPTLDLLEVICEKSSKEDKNGFIQIRSSSDWSRPISPLGFLLLEDIEVELHSALFEIVLVNVMSMDDLLLTALVKAEKKDDSD